MVGVLLLQVCVGRFGGCGGKPEHISYVSYTLLLSWGEEERGAGRGRRKKWVEHAGPDPQRRPCFGNPPGPRVEEAALLFV